MTKDEFYEGLKHKSRYDLSGYLTNACSGGDLDLVKHLLTSPDLPKHADINFRDDLPLEYACSKGQLEIVKYLLTSPELKTHANIHGINDRPIREAIDNEEIAIVEFLVLEMDIPISPYIEKVLVEDDVNPAIKNIFYARDLDKQLDSKGSEKRSRLKL
jgi:ankyrin repeat protein